MMMRVFVQGFFGSLLEIVVGEMVGEMVGK